MDIKQLLLTDRLSDLNQQLTNAENLQEDLQFYDNLITIIISSSQQQSIANFSSVRCNTDPWFDAECQSLRPQLCSIYRSYLNSKAPIIPSSYF